MYIVSMHGEIRLHWTRGCSASVTGEIAGTVFATLTGDFGAEGAGKVQRAQDSSRAVGFRLS